MKSSTKLYPFKFEPIFKEKLWGGQKIKTILGKDFGELENCGESWELSGVQGEVSLVSNGEHKGKALDELLRLYKEALVGVSISNKFGDEFPLLIKFIDANQDLSIQVHPDDRLAKARHNGFGKSEMWYILQADEDASLINGFAKDTDRREYLRHLEDGELDTLLNRVYVKKDDVYYLPAGRVHTIGKGLLLAEIQQTSDLTYRIYDFDRKDKDGNLRELHTEMALDAIDYSSPDFVKNRCEDHRNAVNPIVETPYFTTNKILVDKPWSVNKQSLDSFTIYICTAGQGTVAGESVSFGEVMLIPASLNNYLIEPDGSLELLETYILYL